MCGKLLAVTEHEVFPHSEECTAEKKEVSSMNNREGGCRISPYPTCDTLKQRRTRRQPPTRVDRKGGRILDVPEITGGFLAKE